MLNLKKVLAPRRGYLGKISLLAKVAAFKGRMSAEEKKITEDFRGLRLRGVDLLFIFNNEAPGLIYEDAVLADELTSSGRSQLEIIQHADHLFTPLQSQEKLIAVIQDWAQLVAEPDSAEQRASVAAW